MDVAVFTYGTEMGDGQCWWTFGKLSQPSNSCSKAADWVLPLRQRRRPCYVANLDRPRPVGWTPMCKAFKPTAQVVKQHTSDYPDSFPPIVINITDGISSIMTMTENSLSVRQKITSGSTSDGEASSSTSTSTHLARRTCPFPIRLHNTHNTQCLGRFHPFFLRIWCV